MTSEKITKSGILIIDPQPNMAALVAGMLRTLGRRDVREVNDASQAQMELRRRPFELVIIDDDLTKPDAVAIVRQLRADAESINRLAPIIMMSAAPDAARIAAQRPGDAGEPCEVRGADLSAARCDVERSVEAEEAAFVHGDPSRCRLRVRCTGRAAGRHALSRAARAMPIPSNLPVAAGQSRTTEKA